MDLSLFEPDSCDLRCTTPMTLPVKSALRDHTSLIVIVPSSQSRTWRLFLIPTDASVCRRMRKLCPSLRMERIERVAYRTIYLLNMLAGWVPVAFWNKLSRTENVSSSHNINSLEHHLPQCIDFLCTEARPIQQHMVHFRIEFHRKRRQFCAN